MAAALLATAATVWAQGATAQITSAGAPRVMQFAVKYQFQHAAWMRSH